MTKLELKIHDSVITTINKIKSINDSGMEIIIPEGSILFENVLNLKLIEKYAEERGVSLQFTTNDSVGNNLLSMLNGKTGTETFLTENLVSIESTKELPSESTGKRTFSFSKIFLPFSKINLENTRILLVAIPIVLVGAYYYTGKTLPKATAKIIVYSQPLTRSLTIKVTSNDETSVENKILKGTTLNISIDGYKEIDTTGEKLVGEKAEGNITVYNKTDEEIELESGVELAYKGTSIDFIYYLKDSVTIPARVDPIDPADPIIPGEAIVKIEALDIGDSYNIEEDSNLEFENYKKSEVEGKATENIDGGKSELKKTVSEEDQTKLSEELLAENTKTAEENIKKQATSNQSMVEGSTQSTLSNESFSHEVDYETDKVSLTQSVYSEGLVYSEKDLDSLLDKLVNDLIPEGFILSKKDRDVSIDVLGNSTNSILSSKEADLQVTLKTHVIPDIDENTLKETLKGKSSSEAQKILGSVKNVKTYEFSLVPSIPFFQKVPNNLNKISIEIETN